MLLVVSSVVMGVVNALNQQNSRKSENHPESRCLTKDS